MKEHKIKVKYNPKNGKYYFLNKPDSFISLSIKITDRCDLNCFHCCSYGYPLTDITYKDIKKILDKLEGTKVKKINITGGEPLLHKDLVRILNYAKSKEFTVGLSTNLYSFMEKDSKKEIIKNVDNIKTSLFCNDKKNDQITRKKGAYFKIIKAIKFLKQQNIPIFVQTTVLKENINSLLKIARLCNRLGISRLTFYSLINQGRATKLELNEKIKTSHIARRFTEIKETKEKEKWAIEIGFLDWEMSGQYILILQDGTVTANPLSNPPENREKIGSIFNDTINSLWKKYKYKKAHLSFYSAH